MACTQTLFFLFVLFENIDSLASEASARERKIKNVYFLLPSPLPPTTTPLHWRSINPLWLIFHHPRSADFKEKIEGL